MEGLLKAAEGTANDRICEICDRTFSNVSNKRKHLKNIHGLEDLATTTEKSSDVTCEQCGKVFTRVSSKRQHVKVHHVLGRTNRTSTVTCSTCDGTFGTLHTYREHLHHVHGVIINCVHHQFDSKEEFMSWKDAVEMNIGVNYTAHSGSNTTRDGLKKIYYCRRSGVKKASGDSCNKRAEKSQGTSKMGFYCTSSMEALVCDDGRVLVTYYTDHHNHDLDFLSLVHMKLPSSEKDKIAGMILQGISYDKILDQVRDSAGTSRAALLEKKDIENIVSQFGLNQEHMRHPEDSTSVRLFVKELQESNELLYFKDQNTADAENPGIGEKEFVLSFMKDEQRKFLRNLMESSETLQICMDSTHCISQYEGYQLTTLMTVTNLNQGFPVAFLVSSTVNVSILNTFLAEVKKCVGGPINADVFMSDDDAVFRNAWNATMNEETSSETLYLNCTWHTDRTLRRSIGSKICAPVSEKTVVYQMFRALMDEPEEASFYKQCQGFLNYLSQSNFHNFEAYFKETYLSENRIQLWPKCFRRGVKNFHTNNHLESMHRVLKYVYLKGKKVKRLDYTLFSLGKLVKDTVYKRMIDLVRNRTRRNGLHERHRQGMELEVIQEDKKVFYVSSASSNQKKYKVVAQSVSCEKCRERCTYCDVCQCMYACTCDDSDEGRKNICKHIHAVARIVKDQLHLVKHKPSSEEIEAISSIALSKTSKLPCSYSEKITLVLSKLTSACQDIADEEVYKAVNDHLQKALAIANTSKIQIKRSRLPVDVATAEEPANKLCTRQEKLYSTKRKRKHKGPTMRKPNAKMRREIGESMANFESDMRILVKSEGNIEYEHNY